MSGSYRAGSVLPIHLRRFVGEQTTAEKFVKKKIE